MSALDDNTIAIKEQWKAVRDLLKVAIIADEIPLDTKVMRPKAVYEKYKDNPVMKIVTYDDKYSSDKFTRMLRALRKKHKDGDLETEGLKIIEWGKSAAKQFLKLSFRNKTIPTDYDDDEQVWNDYCKDNKAFERMLYDAAFKRRLSSVRDDYMLKAERCRKDQEAFDIAKKNHPTPELNSRGEPQWNGSRAQALLKQDIEEGNHVGKTPRDLQASRPEYNIYDKQAFRDHIYQEQRLVKFQNYVEGLRQKKIDDLQY